MKSIWIHWKTNIGTEELSRRLAAKKGIPVVSPSIISKVLAAAENHGDGDEEEDNNTPASNFETKMLQALQNGKGISYTDIGNHIIVLLVNHIKRCRSVCA